MASDGQGAACILVVEDSPDLNLVLCEILESHGYEVRSALDGEAALDVLRRYTPDIILSDIMMPRMDGYALFQSVRADDALRMTPFIFLTARTEAEERRQARGMGVEDYLTKPVDENELLLSIQGVLRRRQVIEEVMQRRLDTLRSRIVGLLQHEFRTPLTFVLGYAEYLLETIDPDEGLGIDFDDLRSSASAILEGGRRLEALIESFLLLAELQNRKLKAESLMQVGARELWQESVIALRSKLAAAGLTAEVAAKNSGVSVKADLQLVGEALRRLLDNAIRYRRAESRRIRLEVVCTGLYVGLRITDDSSGMSPELVARLTDPFAHEAKYRTQGSAGLSLALVDHIARLHGGSFELKSTLGRGTTATLWLPQMAPANK